MMTKTVLLVSLVLQAGSILVDKVAATVNGEIITIHDIERAIALFPVSRQNDESEEVFYRRVLDDLVTCKVVALEYGDEFSLGEEDDSRVQTQILQKAGSLERLRAVLADFDMNWNDLKTFIRERVLYEKILQEKLPLDFAVPFSEIEEFYNREYLPSQVRLGLEPRSLAEMTPSIETHLRDRRMQTRRSVWVADLRAAYTIEIKFRSPQ